MANFANPGTKKKRCNDPCNKTAKKVQMREKQLTRRAHQEASRRPVYSKRIAA